LDCSTTGPKAIAFDRKGRIAAAAQASNPLFSPNPGYYEQKREDWWSSPEKHENHNGRIDPKELRRSQFQIREKRLSTERR